MRHFNAKTKSSIVVNLNVYNADQLALWAASNKTRPVIYARVNPHVKELLSALVALQETNKAVFIENLVTEAVLAAVKKLRVPLPPAAP